MGEPEPLALLPELTALLDLVQTLLHRRSGLYLIIAGSRDRRASIAEALVERLSDFEPNALHPHRDHLDPAVLDVPVGAVARLVLAQVDPDDPGQATFLRDLNLHREWLLRPGMVMVLFLEGPKEYLAFQEACPDLWAFRSQTVTLLPDAEMHQRDHEQREALRAALSQAAEDSGLRPVAAWPLAGSVLAGVPAELLWERLGLWRGGNLRAEMMDLVGFIVGSGPLPASLEDHRPALGAIARLHGLGAASGAPPLTWPDWETARAMRIVGSAEIALQPLDEIPDPPWPAGSLPGIEQAGESLDRLVYAQGTALVAGGTEEDRSRLATTWALLRRGRYDGIVELQAAGGLVAAISAWLRGAGVRCIPPGDPAGAMSLLAQAIGEQRALVLLREVGSLQEVDLCRRELQTADIVAMIHECPSGDPLPPIAWRAPSSGSLVVAGLPSLPEPFPAEHVLLRWGRRHLTVLRSGERLLRAPLPPGFYDQFHPDWASEVPPATLRACLLPGGGAVLLESLLAGIFPAARIELAGEHAALQSLPLELIFEDLDRRPPVLDLVRRARTGTPRFSVRGPVRALVVCLDPRFAPDPEEAEATRLRLLGALTRVRGLRPCGACPGTLPDLEYAAASLHPHVVILGLPLRDGAFLLGDGQGGLLRVRPGRVRRALAQSSSLGLVCARPPMGGPEHGLEICHTLARGLGCTLLWAPSPWTHSTTDHAVEGLLRDLAAGYGVLEAIRRLRGEADPRRPPSHAVYSPAATRSIIEAGQPSDTPPPAIEPTPLETPSAREAPSTCSPGRLSPSSLHLLTVATPAFAHLPRSYQDRIGPATGGLPHVVRRLAALLAETCSLRRRATPDQRAWSEALVALRGSMREAPCWLDKREGETLRRISVFRQPIRDADVRGGALGGIAPDRGSLSRLQDAGLLWFQPAGPIGPGWVATEQVRAALEALHLAPDAEVHGGAARYWESRCEANDPTATLQEARHHWREAGDLQAEQRVTEALIASGLARGRPALAIKTAEALFARARSAHDTAATAQAALYLGIAQLRAAPHSVPARQWFTEALDDARVCADGAIEAGARWALAHLDRREAQAQLAVPVPSRGGIARAIACYRGALDHLRAAGALPQDRARQVVALLTHDMAREENPSLSTEAETLWDLSLALERSGDREAALTTSGQTQAAFSTLQDGKNQALAMLDEGRIRTQSGDTDRGLAVLHDARSKLLAAGAGAWAGYADYEIGRSHGSRAWHEQALESFLRAREAFAAAGWRRDQARADSMAATALAYLGRFQEARSHAAAVRDTFEALADPRWVAAAQEKEAWICGMSGDLGAAIQLEEAAIATLERLGEEQPWAYALGNLAGFRRRVGDLDGAIELHERALETFRTRGDLEEQAWSLRAMATTREAQGRSPEAQALAREADLLTSPIQPDVPPERP